MATLTGEQLKDSYQSIVTVNDTISSDPTSGALENGKGTPLTDISIAGDITIADKIIHSGDTNTAIRFPSADTVTIETAGSEAMRIDSSGNVGIGNTSPNLSVFLDKVLTVGSTSSGQQGGVEILGNITSDTVVGALTFNNQASGTADKRIAQISANRDGDNNSGSLGFTVWNGVDSAIGAMTIDTSGNVGIGTDNPAVALHIKRTTGSATLVLQSENDQNSAITFGETSDISRGALIYSNQFDSMTFQVNNLNDAMVINSSGHILPGADDSQDLGSITKRFDNVYATNGTIQTSDINEKQDIEELDDAELRVAQKAKTLLRKFRWKSSVEEKGDDARIHFGIIAQDLEQAFTDEGLDAGRYGMFIKSTWTNEDGEEQTRLGVRYNQLLAFIISAL